MDQKITVRIDSSRPIFIEADSDSFGQIFAGLNDDEQVNVLRSMVEHMKPHKIQWDYIAIALEKDANRQVRDDLSVIFPTQHELLAAIAAKDAEIDRLREALEPFAKVAKHDIGHGEDNQDLFQPMLRHNRAPRLTVGNVRAAFNAHGDKDDAL